MKKTGAECVVFALEELGITHTFGVPGVHNTEIYDAINSSKKITPVLVTHEGGGAFMADAMSRTSGSTGTLVIVPAAGLTQAMSGIAEAFLDGIPMLVISGGVRRDSGRAYQLHQIDQEKLLGGMIKRYFLPKKHGDIVPMLFEAYQVAHAGEPGPVFVEIPAELQLFKGELDVLPHFTGVLPEHPAAEELIETAAEMLKSSEHPGIYVGWGAVGVSDAIIELAEKCQAPVATTFQGISSFPANHPLHVGVGFGASSIPAGQQAFEHCDCLLAVGVRFAELATGSYGMRIPEKLIHIDINPEVFHKNYPALCAIQGDSVDVLPKLARLVEARPENTELKTLIAKAKGKYTLSWMCKPQKNKVSPGHFYKALQSILPEDWIAVVDDGKHTFLTAELLPINRPRQFISPTDFNCMGYCVPASIGAKFGNPEKMVVGIVGDGAFLMTGLELLTAVNYKLPLVIFVFHDGELGQISQFQKTPLNRKTCTVLGALDVSGVARAVGARYIRMSSDTKLERDMTETLNLVKEGETVLVDVAIDYSRKTCLTRGVVKTSLGRFPFKEKMRFILRALKRHTFG